VSDPLFWFGGFFALVFVVIFRVAASILMFPLFLLVYFFFFLRDGGVNLSGRDDE
jgi:hypothetical protein